MQIDKNKGNYLIYRSRRLEEFLECREVFALNDKDIDEIQNIFTEDISQEELDELIKEKNDFDKMNKEQDEIAEYILSLPKDIDWKLPHDYPKSLDDAAKKGMRTEYMKYLNTRAAANGLIDPFLKGIEKHKKANQPIPAIAPVEDTLLEHMKKGLSEEDRLKVEESRILQDTNFIQYKIATKGIVIPDEHAYIIRDAYTKERDRLLLEAAKIDEVLKIIPTT